MKKDAGRGCWSSPYFQGENGGSKVTSNKGDSDELSDDQTNEPCDISYQSEDKDIFASVIIFLYTRKILEIWEDSNIWDVLMIIEVQQKLYNDLEMYLSVNPEAW